MRGNHEVHKFSLLELDIGECFISSEAKAYFLQISSLILI